MTACVNKKSKRVAAVVTASLVGALSIGAPAVALAANANIDLQFAEGNEFANGDAELSFTNLSGQNIIAVDDADGIPTFTAEKLPVKVSATELTLAGSGTKKVAINSDNIHDYKIRVYKADEKGEPTGTPLSGRKVVDAGEYVVTVSALTGSPYAGQAFKARFNVNGMKLPSTITAFQDDEVDDTKFIYTGSSLAVGFKDINDNKLVEGRDYTVSYKLGNKDVAEINGTGTYTATLTGHGIYAGSSAQTKVVVEPFVLDDATIEVDPFVGEAPTSPSRVYRTDKGFTTYLDPSLVGIVADDTISASSADAYTFNVTLSKDVIGNVTLAEDKTTTGHKVDVLCDFQYNGQALADAYELDASKNEKFNTALITATYGKNNKADVETPVVTRTLGTAADGAATDLANGVAGEYKVTVKVAAKKDSNNVVYAGSKTFTVRIYKGIIDADSTLYVYHSDVNDGKTAITSYAKAYDGALLKADSFDLVGKDNAGTAISAGDLKVKLVDSKGNTVTEAVEAGEYKLVVTSDMYKLSGTTELPVTIAKVDLTTLKVGELEKWNDVSGEVYFPLQVKGTAVNTTDVAISGLGLSYNTGNEVASGAKDQSYDFKGFDLVPGNLDAVVEKNVNGTWKEVGSIEDAGEYRVTVSVSSDVASNYVLPEGENEVTIEFTVAKKGYTWFADVQPSDWFYGAVTDAVTQKYMNGYADSKSFGPNDTLTRGQAVTVLYNMSGAKVSETEQSYDEQNGWLTGFADVDGNIYYAEAIYWANQTGVVNGYGDGTFQADKTVSREEFAIMLANYAKLVNRDEEVGNVDVAEALKGFADAGKVSDWAASSVAWAVEKDVMGNGGAINPSGLVSRAEAAAMSINYQPKAKN